ncbi:WYL domain-containing protein, partial [Bacillus paralicheniformis]|uniref:WYL domain-containing protein n=2 Tax=Bacillus TaxID=1386 RepID=UPI002DBF541F
YENGQCVATVSYPEDQWLYGFLLQFGTHIEVLAPPRIRQKIKNLANQIVHLYET